MAHGEGQILVVLPPQEKARADFMAWLVALRRHFGDRCYLAAHHLYRGDDARRIAGLAELASRVRLPLVATNDVHAHSPERRPLLDVLTCIREGCTVAEAGLRLAANGERHLKTGDESSKLTPYRRSKLTPSFVVLAVVPVVNRRVLRGFV